MYGGVLSQGFIRAMQASPNGAISSLLSVTSVVFLLPASLLLLVSVEWNDAAFNINQIMFFCLFLKRIKIKT